MTTIEHDADAASMLDISNLPLAEALDRLQEVADGNGGELELRDRLLPKQILTFPNVFSPGRGPLSEHHLSDLSAMKAASGDLEPLLVWRCGKFPVLLDGHHRLKVYLRADRDQPVPVPVVWFSGTAEEATIRAARAKSRPSLPMTRSQRSDLAWTLVQSGRFTIAQVIEAASVSRTTVQTMRRVKREIEASQGDGAADAFPTWWQAASYNKGGRMWDQDNVDELKRIQAEEWADRLAKTFSTKLANNPEIAALALATYFGRRGPELVRALMDEVGEPEPEEDDEDLNTDF